jgi:DNA-binding transcriptional LysR family regulator
VDIELLRTFLEVNYTRHFGRAAEALHLTQAAVSARIKLLERTLGVRLFDRQRRDIRLTPEGTRLVRHADLLIAEWRKARQDVSAGGADAQLAVGGSLRLWDVLLQAWLHRLGRNRPELAIIAESHTPEFLNRRLLDGALDLAFMLEPAQLEVLQIVEVALIKLVLVSSTPARNAAQALGGDYVMVDWGLAHALEHRRQFPDAPEPRLRFGQAKMALAYLLELGGSAYLPMRMVSAELDGGLLHLVHDAPEIERHAYAVFPVRSGREPLIRQTLALFEQDVPA